MSQIWIWEQTVYPSAASAGPAQRDLTGYEAEATDGGIGRIDEASNEVGSGHLVVDTGWWIFGKKRMIPAGVVTQIDDEDRKVFVSCTKEQVKAAPDYDDSMSTRTRPAWAAITPAIGETGTGRYRA